MTPASQVMAIIGPQTRDFAAQPTERAFSYAPCLTMRGPFPRHNASTPILCGRTGFDLSRPLPQGPLELVEVHLDARIVGDPPVDHAAGIANDEHRSLRD